MQLHAHYQKSHLHFVCNSNCNLFSAKIAQWSRKLRKKGIVKRKRKKNGKSNTLFFVNFGHLLEEISGGPL